MTTSVSQQKTPMRLSREQVQEFSAEVMEREIFGAFMLAFDTRREEARLTQSQLAERLGKDKTGTSKLLAGPRNWTIRTISDMSLALDVVVEISLHDRIIPTRTFTPTGVTYHSSYKPFQRALYQFTGPQDVPCQLQTFNLINQLSPIFPSGTGMTTHAVNIPEQIGASASLTATPYSLGTTGSPVTGIVLSSAIQSTGGTQMTAGQTLDKVSV